MKVVSFHTLHDANVSVAVDGKIVVVLELERLFDQRYFCSNPRRPVFIKQWTEAIRCVTEYAKITQFDVAITSWVMPSEVEILKSLVNASRWQTVDHHLSHAALGFYDSPYQSALVFSYDGGGNDGTFNVYSATRSGGVHHLEWVGLNLGTPYRQLANAMPSVTGVTAESSSEMSNYMRFAPLAFAGKVMGYSALGTVREEWRQSIKKYYTQFVTPLQAMYTLGVDLQLSLEPNALDEESARDVAATSQGVFEELLCEQIGEYLLKSKSLNIDGIVLTGGCALNVIANQLVFNKYGYNVHVACAPNDCGISAGAAWIVEPPSTSVTHSPLQYIGLPLFDGHYVSSLVKEHSAKATTTSQIAKLLVEDGAIIAVVRGRQEFGPRALGHRSLLCHPNRCELKDTINRLKSREWYRPLCPSVAVESVHKLFYCGLPDCAACSCQQDPSLGDPARCRLPPSPYMSFACHVRPRTKELFPAICHIDDTARLQTVAHQDDPWYHSLLCEVGKLNGGYEILMNTSFNVKGKPIVNRAKTALDILNQSSEPLFKYIVIEDWLFTK